MEENATEKIIARAAERSKRHELSGRSNSKDQLKKHNTTPLSQFKPSSNVSPISFVHDSTLIYESYKLLPQFNRAVSNTLKQLTHSSKSITASTLSVFRK